MTIKAASKKSIAFKQHIKELTAEISTPSGYTLRFDGDVDIPRLNAVLVTISKLQCEAFMLSIATGTRIFLSM